MKTISVHFLPLIIHKFNFKNEKLIKKAIEHDVLLNDYFIDLEYIDKRY